MTFVLSQISRDGVFMAADSSEKITRPGREPIFRKVKKIHYFQELNIGVSTWGEWPDCIIGVDDFLVATAAEFTELRPRKLSPLTGFADLLAGALDKLFQLDGRRKNTDCYTGFHVCGYLDPDHAQLPGFCNVFLEENFLRFEAQRTKLICDSDEVGQLTNGIYRPFAKARDNLYEAARLIMDVLQDEHQDASDPDSDLIAAEAEWLGGLVRLVCTSVKRAGLKEVVGKDIDILYFDHEGIPRWYRIPQMVKRKGNIR